MKNSLLFLLIIVSAFAANAQGRFGQQKTKTENSSSNLDLNYASPREYEIAEITVSGTKFLDAGALISLSGLKVGDKIKIPSETISGAIRKLWRQGIVGDVEIAATKIEGDKIYLNISLKERPKLTRFFFKGIRKGETETLTEKIDLIKGKVVNEAILKNTQLTLEKHFIDKGFLNTRANIIQKEDSLLSNSVLLNININKGKRVKIKKLTFEGNEVFSDKKLAKKLKDTKQKKPFRIFKASKYIKSKYEDDKDNLIKFFNAQGYRDARIISDTLYSVDKKHINMKLEVEEGRKYYFRNITWTGNYIYSSEQLSTVLGMKKGDVYDLEKLEKRLNFSQTDLDITSLYMDDGYLFFSVNPVEVAIEGDSVDVEMQISEGAQANINKVILNGNTKTSDKVVLREIRTTPGQKFSRSALIRSQREIATLGYFDPEKIGINPLPNIDDQTVDIEYTVEEKPSDQIELSGGWGGAFGFVGTLGVVFNNFSIRKLFKFKEWGGILPSGDGQRLALRLQANGRAFQTYSLTFTEPWLGGRKPNSFTVNLSHSIQRSYITQTDFGTLKVSSLTLSLGRRLLWPDDYFTLSNALIFTGYSYDRFASFFNGAKGVSNTVAFNTTLSRNSIDNPTFPRSGSSMSLSISLTPPYSLFENRNYANLSDTEKFRFVEYHKWLFDSSWFTNLFGKFVLNARAHFGYIGAYNQKLGVGPFERFVLGGDGLTGQNFLLGTEIIGLRGYANNSITPRGVSGGVVYDKFVMDIRYPVSLNPAATIFVLAFVEGGNNWGNYAEFNPFDLKRSAGLGARIFMPAFGMIGLDWGYGFDDIPGNTDTGRSRFHFTIGQQIR